MLHAILDDDAARAAGWNPADLAASLLGGGVRFIQVRAKHLPSERLLELCDAVIALARPYGAKVIVNDRADVAVMSHADGVHVGQTDLAVAAARELLGANAIVGYSTHSIDQVRIAAGMPLSYIAVGPVFATESKQTGYSPVGLQLVREAVRRAGEKPVIGIGGVTLENAPDVIAAGASGVAVIADLLRGGDPGARAAEFVAVLG
jgi:thiamine-phosphate pyrophosphorylase